MSGTENGIRSLGGWLVAAPFVLGFASPAASRSACIAGILLLITTDVARIVAGMGVLPHQQISRYRVSKLSPEKIADCKASETDRPVTPEALSKQIVERSEQIRKTLLANPSEVEIEMCLLGYKSCAADMLLLEGLFEKELPKTGPIRRMKLNAARWKAIDSLTKTRGALPPATMRTLYPEDSGEKNE